MKKLETSPKKVVAPLREKSPSAQNARTEKVSEKPSFWKVELPSKTMVKFWFLGWIFAFLGYLLIQSLDMIYLIITALIISVSMEGIIYAFEKKIKTRGLAIGIAYFLLMLFLLSGIVFVIPFLISQFSMLVSWISSLAIELKNFILTNQRPAAIQQIAWLPEVVKSYFLENWSNFSWSNADFQSAVLSSLNSLLDTSATSLKRMSSGFFSVIGGFFGVLANLTIIFTLAVFFSIEKKYLISLFIRGSDEEKKQKVRLRIDNIYEKLSLRFKARIILSLFVAIAMYLMFWILRLFGIVIPNMFPLALITGLLDIVPYLGPVFAFIPIVVLALVHNGFWGMIIVGVLFFVVQWIQNNVVTPILMEKQLGVNPLLILVAALLGAVIMGFRGVILSVPLAVIVGLFIDEKK